MIDLDVLSHSNYKTKVFLAYYIFNLVLLNQLTPERLSSYFYVI